mmetsp:Transcript_19769/g.36402  ORF Transcript_19769/g.36402 Transcript_19769/m.36402 type:complete len:285 (-) Transcript_19769:313-1167(-)
MADLLSVFEQGKAAYDEFDFNKAAECFAVCYKFRSSQHFEGLLDTYAEVACTLGDEALAKSLYEESVRADPLSNPAKYFALAQLSEGREALNFYTTGLDAYNRSLFGADPTQTAEINAQMAKGASAVAELYMTDLCDEPEAEHRCEELLRDALNIDANCIDAWQATLNLRLIRARIDEAKATASTLRSIISNLPEGQLPTTQFLGETVRMMFEVGDFEAAIEIADISLSMDENQPDIMYIQAFSLSNLVQTDSARETLRTLKAKFPNLPADLEQAVRELGENLQ